MCIRDRYQRRVRGAPLEMTAGGNLPSYAAPSGASSPPDPPPDIQPDTPGAFTLTVKSIADGPGGKKVGHPHPVVCTGKVTIGQLKAKLSAVCGIPFEEVWLLLQQGEGGSNRCVFLKQNSSTLDDYAVSAESAVWCFRRATKPPKAPEDDIWQWVIGSLQGHGLEYHRSGGDGNCLFRSVSMVLYGDESVHEIVRAHCLDYMVAQAHAFEPVVAGDFGAYVQAKRKTDGSASSWGDEPELLAMSELYSRPIQVWTFIEEPDTGRLEPQIFSKYEPAMALQGAAPIRVVFLGKGHYDALLPIGQHELQAARIASPPGEYELDTIAKIKHLSLIHISEPTRLLSISYAVFCLKKKKKKIKMAKEKV
eukprot:TRINITY_DN20491_c0_g1_i8.p1 TRINITY_DN20491_c0_g1~~TRINITY_DN20491_c0_g1_i8.p1  ORF type:complete len:365 (+),score=102.69 TRINITY_DN20491_c0_g1_i8:170-1264(+)